MRVTENLMLRNLLARAGGSLARVTEWQERIASGRRLLRASDDPQALSKILAVKADLRQSAAFLDNASSATAHMSLTETALSQVSDLASRAKEIVLAGSSDTSETGGVDSLVRELRAMLDELVIVANREVAGRRLFAGTATRTPPYSAQGGVVAYRGDEGDILEELSPGLRVAINLTGPDAFETVPSRITGSVDLDPAVSGITELKDLFGGRGMVGGHLRITDSNGVSQDIDVLDATNLGQVIQAINNAGTAVVAQIAPDGKSLLLTDTGGGVSFDVQDLYGGSLAKNLGIATTSTTGSIQGVDLDPAVTEGTAMALLLGGAGIGPGLLTLGNDSKGVSREATIDPAQANTVGELLDLLEGATTPEGVPLGIRARLDGTGIVIESTRLHTALTVSDSGGASGLRLGVIGVGEARDLFTVLEDAATAVSDRDDAAMKRILTELTAAVENTAGIRGTYGARARQVLSVASSLEDQSVDMTVRLSDLEDVDLARAALELSRAEVVYNAALGAGTRVFARNLFDYIR